MAACGVWFLTKYMCSWAHEPCVFMASLLFSRRPPLTHDERRTTNLSLPVSRAGTWHFSRGPAAGTTLFARLLRIARGSAEKLWPSSFINKQTNRKREWKKGKKHTRIQKLLTRELTTKANVLYSKVVFPVSSSPFLSRVHRSGGGEEQEMFLLPLRVHYLLLLLLLLLFYAVSSASNSDCKLE